MADQGHNKYERFPKPVTFAGGILDDFLSNPILVSDIEKSVVFDAVSVETEADLPAPVGGVITLESGKHYIISKPIVYISNRLLLPEDSLVKISGGVSRATLAYVGVGTMLTGVNIDGLTLVTIALVAPGGTLFDITGTSTANSYIVASLTIFQAKFLGKIYDITCFVLNCIYSGFNQGIEFKDNSIVANIATNIINTTNTVGCIYFTYKGTIPFIIFNSCVITNIGTNEHVFNFDPALISVSSYFNGILATGAKNIFAAGSLDQKHLPFKFVSCVNIADSTVTTQIKMDVAYTTDIPAANAWVIINGNASYTCDTAERVTCSTDGGVKYIGYEDILLNLIANVNLEPALASKNIECSFMFIEDGLFAVTFTNATNTVNRVGHGLLNGNTISFKFTAGTLPTGLRKDILYYVVNAAADTFQVSYTSGGAAINFTTDGVPTNSYSQAYLVGGIARSNITAFDPIDLVPSALAVGHTNDYIYLVIRNTSDAVDIDVNHAFYKVFK